MSAASRSEWQVAAILSDVTSVRLMVSMPEGERVPARLTAGTALLAEAQSCEVRVPFRLAHRASWLMTQSQVSDAELRYLATGELEGGDNAE